MARIWVVSFNFFFLMNIIGKRKCILDVYRLDNVVNFFVVSNQINQFLDLIWPCQYVNDCINGRRVLVFSQVPHFFNIIWNVTQSSFVRQSLTVYNGYWLTTSVAYSSLLIINSWATLCTPPGLFIANTFIIFEPFNRFQKVFDQSKFVRNVAFDLTKSIYSGVGPRSSISNAGRQRWLRVWGVDVPHLFSVVFFWLVLLSRIIP